MAKIVSLDPSAIAEGVYRRLDDGRSFVGRDAYFGASEVGRCQRRVLHEKVTLVPNEVKFSLPSAWKVILGRVLENEAVQILRLTGVKLRETGVNQVEVVHPDMPFFKCHPDGRVLAPFEHHGFEDGDGSLEAKNTASYIVREWLEHGLPQDYKEQHNSQMGLQGLKWGLFVATWRDGAVKGSKLPFMHWWHTDFDPELYEQTEARAAAMEAKRLILVADMETRGPDAEPNPDLLPDGEPSRGWCTSCHLAPGCKAYLNSAPELASGEALPDDARLQLEVILEELGPLEEELDPLAKRQKELKEMARPIVPLNVARKFVLEGGEVVVSIANRASFDQELVKSEAPDLYARACGKKPTPSLSLKPRRTA